MLSTAIDVLTNADLGETFTIIRSNGQFAAGGYQTTPTEMPAFGTVSPAGPRELEMIPEADRVHSMRIFKTTQPMYVTAESRPDGTSGTSDVIRWQGIKYRIFRVFEYPQRGWWGAIAARKSGA